MRIILALALFAISLGGCATVKNLTNGLTSDYSKPITREMLYNVENGSVVIFAGLNAYKKACVEKLVGANCRAVVIAIQKQSRKLPPLLAGLRSFVKSDDRINAVTAYNTIMDIINEVKAIAKANNIS